jgi:hypothetical protein
LLGWGLNPHLNNPILCLVKRTLRKPQRDFIRHSQFSILN